MRFLAIISAFSWLLLTACMESDFTGKSGEKTGNGAVEDGSDGEDEGAFGPGDKGSGENESRGESSNDADGRSDEGLDTGEEEIIFEPQACTGDNGFVAYSGTQCPEHSAAFLSDDGNAARVACCPLPARDILDPDSDPVARGTSCEAEEVAVGAHGDGFICHRINTKKYRLGEPQTSCYYGSGLSGSLGASGCAGIIAQFQALIDLVGDKDGCLAQPYGALMVEKTGKHCGSQKSAQILDLDGNPVQIFP